MIIETRVWNKATKTMVYMKPLKAGIGCVQAMSMDHADIVLDESDPIMMKSPILAENGLPLWEGDVCECGVVTSYGLVKEYGVLLWRGDKGGFIMQIENAYEGKRDFQIAGIVKVGNIYENPEFISNRKKDDVKTLPQGM